MREPIMNFNKLTAEIDLTENVVYIVVDKKLTRLLPKEYGTDELIWKDGRVIDVIRSQRKRISGQGVI